MRFGDRETLAPRETDEDDTHLGYHTGGARLVSRSDLCKVLPVGETVTFDLCNGKHTKF